MLVCLSGGVLFVRHLLRDPRVVMLTPRDDAQWIRADEPIDLTPHVGGERTATFRTRLHTTAQETGGLLRVCALRRVAMSIDGQLLFDSGPVESGWKREYAIELPHAVGAGDHVLELKVTNTAGACVMQAYCPERGIRSDTAHWDASTPSTGWKPAVLASAPWEPAVERLFRPAYRDVLSMLPWLCFVFIAGILAARRRSAFVMKSTKRSWALWFRWGLMTAWLLLAVNNLFKLPLDLGYDWISHLEYIQYVAEHWRVPPPGDGWQFFQTPLYYFISAALYRAVLHFGATADDAALLLRIVPALCGVAMVEISYRVARCAFRGRDDLQIVCTAVASLVPMWFYMANTVSNEPLAGCLGGLLVLWACRFMTTPARAGSFAQLAMGGVTLGLALLAKVSMAIWIVPLLAALLLALRRQGDSWRRAAFSLNAVAMAMLLVSGWYFAGNWLRYGAPLHTHGQFDQGRWWQDPGYRTPENLMRFGHVFTFPAYSGLRSVWDSIYSTMWSNGFLIDMRESSDKPSYNYRLMSCALWLSMAPMFAIAVGAIGTPWSCLTASHQAPERTESIDPAIRGFAVSAVALFITAIVYVYLTLPIFSCAKASYMLSATPCLGVLAAAGFDRMARHPLPRAIGVGFLCCWAVTAYLAFFIV